MCDVRNPFYHLCTAQKLNCHVMIGFPQRITEPDVRQIYNALGIVSNRGELIKVYHKTQLYPPVDPLWARPGDGFLVMDLNIARINGEPNKPVKCCIGVCMDVEFSMTISYRDDQR